VLFKQVVSSKKEVNKMIINQSRRPGRSRREALVEISLFCDFLFQFLLMDSFETLCGVCFTWWNCDDSDDLLNNMLVIVMILSWDVSMMIISMVIFMMFSIYIIGFSKLLVVVMLD
jgi:hypothetical protein